MTNTIFESLTQSSWGWALARSLAHSLWQGALLGALLALVLRPIPSYRSRLRYGLALVALTGFPLLLALNLVLTMSLTTTPLHLQAGAPTGPSAGAAGPLQAVPGQLGAPLNLSLNFGLFSLPWEGLGASLYVLGVVLLALRGIVQLLYLRRLRRTAVPVDEILYARLRRLAGLTGTRVPRLAFSSRVDTAMVMGWRAPLVLLPARVEAHLTPRQLDGVLLHELAHIKTHDCAANTFQLLAETLLFYHPALWWVSGVVRQEREYRCDDLAAHACGDRRDYAEALLAREKARSRPTAAVALAGTSGDFAARVQRLFGRPAPHSNLFKLALRLVAALTLGVSAGFAQPRAPELSAPTSSLQNTPRPEEPLASERELDSGGDQNDPNELTAHPFGEPTPAGCAALGGRWFHIKIAGFSPEPPVADPGIAVPLKLPAVKFQVKTPEVAYRGRCAVEQPGD